MEISVNVTYDNENIVFYIIPAIIIDYSQGNWISLDFTWLIFQISLTKFFN